MPIYRLIITSRTRVNSTVVENFNLHISKNLFSHKQTIYKIINSKLNIIIDMKISLIQNKQTNK